MAKKVKMADIAAKLNISTVTVSKALTDQKGVSEELREKIKLLANQMNYRHPSSYRNGRSVKSYNIGIIIPDKYLGKYESFYWKLYQKVATEAVQKECFTMLEVISTEDEGKQELPKLIKEKRVDGAILLGKPGNGYVRKLKTDGSVPVVCLDFFDESNHFDSVISDGFYGTYILTNYLFEMGHEDIAYVGTLMFTGSITDRYFGYCKSMLEHGRKVPDEWVMDDRDWETGDVASFKLKFPERMPTAFVCNCDLTASNVIKSLKEIGYSVPDDISVVGFDNFIYPGLCDIRITTYEVDTREMARTSISMLLSRMENKALKPVIKVIDGHIVYKDSVKHRIGFR